MDDGKTLYEIEYDINADYEKLTLEKKMIAKRELRKWIDENKDRKYSYYSAAMVARSIIDNIKKESE